jgi:hypothetical protein
MRDLSVETVFAAVGRLLAENSRNRKSDVAA